MYAVLTILHIVIMRADTLYSQDGSREVHTCRCVAQAAFAHLMKLAVLVVLYAHKQGASYCASVSVCELIDRLYRDGGKLFMCSLVLLSVRGTYRVQAWSEHL